MEFYIWVIIFVAVVIKLMVIGCLYAYRVRRIQALNQQRIIVTQAAPAGGSAYPAAPYNQRSAIVNFEEVPQPFVQQMPSQAMPEPPKYEDVRPPPYGDDVPMQKA